MRAFTATKNTTSAATLQKRLGCEGERCAPGRKGKRPPERDCWANDYPQRNGRCSFTSTTTPKCMRLSTRCPWPTSSGWESFQPVRQTFPKLWMGRGWNGRRSPGGGGSKQSLDETSPNYHSCLSPSGDAQPNCLATITGANCGGCQRAPRHGSSTRRLI